MLIGVPIVSGLTRIGTPLLAVGQDPSIPVVFEVASVKANKSGEMAAHIDDLPGGRFVATNATLRQLMLEAYRIPENQLLDETSWTRTERFDVNARLEHEAPIVRVEAGQRQLALRSLLAERFKLAVHRETRQFPMYALVMARTDQKPGPMLKPSSTDCSQEGMEARRAAIQAGKPVPGMCGTRGTTGRLQLGGRSLADFAKILSGSRDLGRNVIDRTGLTGTWDMDLTFTPDAVSQPLAGREPPAVDPNAPSFFMALQEQLGLKLESIRGPVEVLVIDRVQRLDANESTGGAIAPPDLAISRSTHYGDSRQAILGTFGILYILPLPRLVFTFH